MSFQLNFASRCCLCLAALSATPSEAQSNFWSLTYQGNGWSASLETSTEGPRATPIVDKVFCHAQTDDISFSIDESRAISRVTFWFRTSDEYRYDGGSSASLADLVWVRIGSRRVEVAFVPENEARRRLSNVDYPEPAIRPGEDIILVARGEQMHRSSPTANWMSNSRIFNELLAAPNLRWGFVSRPMGDDVESREDLRNWQHSSYVLKNDKVAEALAWCDANIDAPEARILPPNRNG